METNSTGHHGEYYSMRFKFNFCVDCSTGKWNHHVRPLENTRTSFAIFELLFSLAAADLLVGLIGQPSFVAFKIAELLESFEVYKCSLKMTQFFFGWIISGVIFIILSGICIDSLLALTHLRYQNIVTVPREVTVTYCGLGVLLGLDNFKDLAWRQMDHSPRYHSSCCHSTDCISAHFKYSTLLASVDAMAHIQNRAVDVSNCKKSAVTIMYVHPLVVL